MRVLGPASNLEAGVISQASQRAGAWRPRRRVRAEAAHPEVSASPEG